MQIDLTDKVALVTGSSQGIGLAIATWLASAGAAVVLTGRNPERLAAAEEQLLADVEDARVTAVAGDVVTEEGTAGLLQVAPSVDVLVNNLGVFGAQPALEITDDEWRRYFETTHMCVYLASPLASATTGGALRVEGGYVDSILP